MPRTIIEYKSNFALWFCHLYEFSLEKFYNFLVREVFFFLVCKVRIIVVTPLLYRLKIKEDSAYEGLNTVLVILREERRRKGGRGEKGG